MPDVCLQIRTDISARSAGHSLQTGVIAVHLDEDGQSARRAGGGVIISSSAEENQVEMARALRNANQAWAGRMQTYLHLHRVMPSEFSPQAISFEHVSLEEASIEKRGCDGSRWVPYSSPMNIIMQMTI